MYLKKLLTLIIALFFGTLTAVAGTSIMAPWLTVDGVVGSGAIYGLAIDGTNAYAQLGLNNLVQIVRIADIGGANIRTQLVSPTTWTTASGASSCTSFQGFDLSGTDYLQFGDVTSDAIWRVNKYTGLLINYCSKQAISNFTGRSGAALGAVQCVNPANGEHIFFESTSSKVLTTGGSNIVSLVFNESDATNALGDTATLSGGMNVDNSGNLYFGTSGGFLAKRDTGGNFSVVFTKAVITNITQILTASNFGTMKMGPNGFTFRNGSGTFGTLLQFDPANPSGTLSVFVNARELTNSVAASANVNCIRYFGTYPSASSGWAWHQFGLNGIYLTAVPEPALVGLVGLAALLLRRFV
ncbi:MAG: hypothetical protein NTV22_00425 [bacterium]|nr:hypothetical protein [bacterium]